jgi:hypothetical protein
MRRMLLALTAACLMSTAVQAQIRGDEDPCLNQNAPAANGGQDVTRRQHDFGEKEIHGCVTGPAGLRAMSRSHAPFISLIRKRTNFTPELLKSVDRL